MSSRRRGGAGDRFRQPEVDDLDQRNRGLTRLGLPGSEHEIGRLEVPVNDPACFRRDQRLRGLHGNFQHQAGWQGSVPTHPGIKRLAFDQFHRVETLAVLFAVVRNRRNIGMLELRGCPCFAQEALTGGGVVGNAAANDLEGHRTVQHGVLRPVRSAHRPVPKLDR